MDGALSRPMSAPPVDVRKLTRQPLALTPLKSTAEHGDCNGDAEHTGAAPPPAPAPAAAAQAAPTPPAGEQASNGVPPAQQQQQQQQAAAEPYERAKRAPRAADRMSIMRAYLEEQFEKLDDADKEVLRRSFDIMDAAPQSNAVGVFINLLSEYPPYKQLWPQFREIPDSALIAAGEIRAHAKVFMDGTRLIVNNIDNMDELERHFLRIAATHKRKAIRKQQIDDMLVAMLDSLRQVMGADYTPAIHDAWSKLFDIFGNVVEHYKE